MVLEVKSILSKGPAQTLKSLQEELNAKYINASAMSISRCIKKVGFTRKRLFMAPEERNSMKTIDIPNNRLVFLDETWFYLHLSKHYGYSTINTKCYETVPANRGRNISLILVINIEGIVGYQMKEGSIDGNGLINLINNSLSA